MFFAILTALADEPEKDELMAKSSESAGSSFTMPNGLDLSFVLTSADVIAALM